MCSREFVESFDKRKIRDITYETTRYYQVHRCISRNFSCIFDGWPRFLATRDQRALDAGRSRTIHAIHLRGDAASLDGRATTSSAHTVARLSVFIRATESDAYPAKQI